MRILARPSVLQRDLGNWFGLGKLEGTNPVLIIGSINSGCTDHAQIISSRPRYIHGKSLAGIAGRIAAIMRTKNHTEFVRDDDHRALFKYFEPSIPTLLFICLSLLISFSSLVAEPSSSSIRDLSSNALVSISTSLSSAG